MLLTPMPARPAATQPAYPPVLYPPRDGGPALDIAFAYGQWDPRIAFSRDSAAYYTQADGTLRLVAAGAARTGDRGLLIEGARTNLLRRSQEFDDGALWTVGRLTVTADGTAEGAAAPDGTATADLLLETAETGAHVCFQALTLTTGTKYCWSVYVKPLGATTRWIGIRPQDGAGTLSTVFWDVAAASPTAVVASGSPDGYGIERLADGWSRIWVAETTVANGTGYHQIELYDGATVSFAGDTGSGFHVWGAQVEAGAYPSSYIPTAGSTVTRAADAATLDTADIQGFAESEGALLAELALDHVTTSFGRQALALNDDSGTLNNYVSVAVSFAVNAPSGNILRGGVSQASILDTEPYAPRMPTRVANAYRADDVALAARGVLVGTDGSAQLPVGPLTRLFLGRNAANGGHLDGYIRRVQYWPQRLPDSLIQGLTA